MALDAPARAKRPVRSADDVSLSPYQRILLVGPTGSGKSAQIWTLPGKKFAYVFDPNTAQTIEGCPDLEYIEFLPDFMDLDTALKGFNKESKSDKPVGGKAKEPKLYEEWREHFNGWVAEKEYEKYDWLIFDSLTFTSKAMMDRQLFINNRYGQTEDLADFKVVGGKFSDVFSHINGLSINVFCTGHLQTYEDEKTKRIVTQLYLPGRARQVLPLSFTSVLEAQAGDKAGTFEIKTLPEKRGLQDIRTSLRGLKPVEDATITNFRKAGEYGIGKLLRGASRGTGQKAATS